jgi:hypothetical protein
MDITQTLAQIGRQNLMAISGFRHSVEDGRLILPVSHGYSVSVELENDTYNVRRLFKRGGRVWVKGEARGVYAEQLSETCYRASCFYDEWNES